MVDRNGLLMDLLIPLVKEWGARDVELALFKIAESSGKSSRSHNAGGWSRAGREKPRHHKPLASEQVDRLDVESERRALLQKIASQYDARQFLPTVSDSREFLIMLGERPNAMKDRSDAFRQLLRHLLLLTPERLEQLVSSSSYSGPSQLGALSDAISATAATLPRHKESTTS